MDVAVYDLARAEAREAGVEETLLFDREDRLVEGSGSNLVVVDASGRLATPRRALGGVDGLGLETLRRSFAGKAIREADLDPEALAGARELLATNGVRGVVSIVELDGRPVGDGRPGPWLSRLRAIFFRAPR